jgi:hypothetical protein
MRTEAHVKVVELTTLNSLYFSRRVVRLTYGKVALTTVFQSFARSTEAAETAPLTERKTPEKGAQRQRIRCDWFGGQLAAVRLKSALFRCVPSLLPTNVVAA